MVTGHWHSTGAFPMLSYMLSKQTLKPIVCLKNQQLIAQIFTAITSPAVRPQVRSGFIKTVVVQYLVPFLTCLMHKVKLIQLMSRRIHWMA